MAIEVIEKFESRESTTGDSASVELIYVITGTDDDVAAKAALGTVAPSTHDGLVRQSRHIEPLGPELWLGRARYGKQEKKETGESAFSFDTGGGTQHITQAIATMASYAPPTKTAPDFKGAIGVSDKSVEGVDITTPVYAFAETHYLANAVVTNPYKGILFALTGKVNNAGFKGFLAGECLFLGASGSKRGVDDWEISFRFAASPNKTGLTVGTIVGIDKKGWEYMWVRYADAEDAAAKAIVKRPIAVYIEQVYEYGDFSTLGIGT